MATWTRTENADRILFSDEASLRQYIVWKHLTHWHAEQFFPYEEDAQGRNSPAKIADSHHAWLEANGHTVVVVT